MQSVISHHRAKRGQHFEHDGVSVLHDVAIAVEGREAVTSLDLAPSQPLTT